jgi:hypothetical protein
MATEVAAVRGVPILAALLALATAPAGPATRSAVEARVADLAGGILQPLASARVAPPVPARWPPQGPTALVFHVYAAVFDPGLRDAERILSSWALATLEPGAAEASVRTLRRPTRELGIQGVRPLRPDEQAALSGRDTAETALAQLAREGRADGPEAAEVRRYYCAWLAANGVFAEELRGASPAFFDWLACR